MTASHRTDSTIRIGTRGSRLARWQADWVAERLRRLNPRLRVELIEIKTHGDRDRNSPLAAIGGVGLFTKEIQRAVRDGSVDVAVHSLKDLPTKGLDELLLAAVPAREDAADALISPEYQTLVGLPQGARVGTGSPRRRAQLLFLRPDLQVTSLRGNVETRLNQALDGRLDAVMLAWAGLHRLGLERHITQRLDPSEFLPAVGQGALGIECRGDDVVTIAVLQPLDDSMTRRAVLAERAALAALEGGCTLPMAAWARDVEGDETDPGVPALAINAAVFDPDGCARVGVALRGPRDEPDSLGRRAAQALCDQGAIPLMKQRPSSDDQLG
jgi:hydroxymethylbilane synthase